MVSTFLPLILGAFLATSPEMPSWTVWVPNLVLPVLGIVIVLFCLGSFVFPYGSKFGTATQVIRGYGLDLQISLLTALMLIGVGLSLTGVGIYLFSSARQVTKLEGDLGDARREAANWKKAFDDAQRTPVTLELHFPEGPDPNNLDPNRILCHYLLNNADQDQKVTRTGYGGALTCSIPTVTSTDMISGLKLLELNPPNEPKVLAQTNQLLTPLKPKIDLRRPRE